MKKLVVHTVWTETAELSQVAESDWLQIDTVFPSSLSEVSFDDFKPQEETITSLSLGGLFIYFFSSQFSVDFENFKISENFNQCSWGLRQQL